jgi:signal transduction histidine kinase
VFGSRPERTTRRFWILAGVVGAFLVLDLALFAWLIFRSLSQQELDRVVGEARQEAQSLADRLQRSAERTGGDLYTAVALEQETQAYIDSVLRQRRIVETVEVTDRKGFLVMRARREREAGVAAPETGSTLDVTAPIGPHGVLRIGLDPREMDLRIEQLRGELVRKTGIIGGLTAVLVVVAVALISILIRRGERLEAQAAEAERLAWVGTLAAGLAHEIRNPLNSLNLNMQMLAEDLPTAGADDPRRRLVEITRAEIARLERLVSEFLAYARPRPLELAEVAAIDLLLGVREVLAPQIAQHDAEVRIVDESEEACVRVDEEQMRQLLLNLLQNALAATAGTGRRAEILLTARREAGRVELAVRDNGQGIPPAERARIFDAFYSTRRGGTGLGLAIAERIARAHGGRLTCESDYGFGSQFVLALPLDDGDERPDAAAPVESHA